MASKPKVSVIIPNYNEGKNIKRGVLEAVRDYLQKQPYDWELIISDDGSTDGSIALVETFAEKYGNIHVLKNKHAGKPYALRSAVYRAEGEYVLFTDMDQSSPIQELEKLLPWTKDYNVVIGSRGRRRSAAWYRQLLSVGFWFIRKSIILPDIVDTQCGFKLIKTNVVRTIFDNMRLFAREEKAKGWKVTAYDVEMLHLAKKMHESIKEVRVEWRDEDVSSGKRRNFLKESYEMLFEVVRVKLNDLLGRYVV